MKNLILVLTFFSTLFTGSVNGSVKKKIPSIKKKEDVQVTYLKSQFQNKNDTPAFIKNLRDQVMKSGSNAVPVLVEVMKGKQYSDKKRWMATFSLGKIMGKKSSGYIAKFSRHPNWMLRLASLKTLLALKEKRFASDIADALRDESMIVRMQALENIRSLNMKKYGSNVWKLLFHKHNYSGEKGKRKRTNVIAKAVRVVGDLRYKDAKKSLIKLSQKESYSDIFKDIEYSLEKLTGKKSPKGTIAKKRKFWSKV